MERTSACTSDHRDGAAPGVRRRDRRSRRARRREGCPLTNLALELSLADPEFREAVQLVFATWRSAIASSVRADQAAGSLAHLDAEEFATFVVALFSGAMGLAKATQTTAPLRTCAREIERTMSRTE